MSGLKQTFVTKLTDVNSSAQEPLGTLRYEGNKVYKYVKILNASGTVAGVLGSMVGYAKTGGYNTNTVVVKLADADNPPLAAGALQGTVAGVATVAEYGWIQIKGAATLDTAVTTGAIGKGFTLTTTDKTCTVAVAGDVSPYAGVSVDATTGVCLTCPE